MHDLIQFEIYDEKKDFMSMIRLFTGDPLNFAIHYELTCEVFTYHIENWDFKEFNNHPYLKEFVLSLITPDIKDTKFGQLLFTKLNNIS